MQYYQCAAWNLPYDLAAALIRGDHKVNWPEVTFYWTKLTVDLIGVPPLQITTVTEVAFLHCPAEQGKSKDGYSRATVIVKQEITVVIGGGESIVVDDERQEEMPDAIVSPHLSEFMQASATTHSTRPYTQLITSLPSHPVTKEHSPPIKSLIGYRDGRRE